MADNIVGTPIKNFPEAAQSDLADSADIIVEDTTPTTKRTKLSTLFAWLKAKFGTHTLNSYADIMAATVAGFFVDALAVKEGFNQVNSTTSITLSDAQDIASSATPVKLCEFTAVKTGWHCFRGHIAFGANATGIRIVRNYSGGRNTGYTLINAVTGGWSTVLPINFTVWLEAGQDTQFHVAQNSGGGLTVTPNITVSY